jgi:hypothetical protein
VTGRERLVTLQPPEISQRAVRIELTWPGVDQAIRLLAALAMQDIAGFLLAPATRVSVAVHLDGADRGSLREAARPDREVLAFAVGREEALAAVTALTAIAVGAASHRVAEIRGRLGGQAGQLVATAPPGRRPAGARLELPHPALPVHVLEISGPRSLTATLQWPHVFDWADRLRAVGEAGVQYSLVDDASRHATCALNQNDAEYLGWFLGEGAERGAFPVPSVDIQNDDAWFSAIVPFEALTARTAR